MSVSLAKWFSTPYKRNSERIEQFRLIYLFGIAVSTTAAYLYYHYSLFVYGPNEWGNKLFDISYKSVGVYTVVDLYYSNTHEMNFHHVFILAILLYNEVILPKPEDRFLFTYPMLKTEISSVFYVLKSWLPQHSNVYHINSALFCLSFIKFRIYDYYDAMIHQNKVMDYMIQVYSAEFSSLMYLSVYGLFSLNIYWVFLIQKQVYKTFFLSIQKDIHCHTLCRIVYLSNLVLAGMLFPVYNYECIGTILQSFFAYLYHDNIYQRLALKKIDEYVAPTKDSLLLYIVYLLSIHARSFFAVLNASPYSLFAIFSGILHEISLYCSIGRVGELVDEDKKEFFLSDQRKLLFIPFLVDGLWITQHSPYEIAIPLYTLYFSLAVLHMTNPFYKLTPVAFGLGFMIQTYYTSFIQTY